MALVSREVERIDFGLTVARIVQHRLSGRVTSAEQSACAVFDGILERLMGFRKQTENTRGVGLLLYTFDEMFYLHRWGECEKLHKWKSFGEVGRSLREGLNVAWVSYFREWVETLDEVIEKPPPIRPKPDSSRCASRRVGAGVARQDRLASDAEQTTARHCSFVSAIITGDVSAMREMGDVKSKLAIDDKFFKFLHSSGRLPGWLDS
jgi:hypothetical protein